MEREILFRGKRIDNGEWIEGDLLHDYWMGDNTFIPFSIRYKINGIYSFPITVIPETVGQFTGLTDKSGTKIFDGDVLLSKSWGVNSRNKRKTHIVKWGKVGWIASGYNGGFVVTPQLDVKSDWEVIGNIHDNPKLLK